MPMDFFTSSFVETKAERWFILPHLTSNVVTTPKLIGKSPSVLVEDKATYTTECLCGKELHFGIWIVGFHKPSWMHLYPLQVNGLGTNGLSHLNGITSAMFAIGRGQMQQVWPVLGEQRIGSEVCAIASRGKDHWPKLLVHRACLPVLASNDSIAIHDQLENVCLGDDASAVGLFGDFLAHLDQSVSDRHARETFFATVGARHGVAAEASKEREIQVELVHQPIHICAAVCAKDLSNLWFFGATLQGVCEEDVVSVFNPFGCLRLRCSAIDSGCRFSRVPTTERRLVQEHTPTSHFKGLIGSRHACKAAAHHDHLACWEDSRHCTESTVLA